MQMLQFFGGIDFAKIYLAIYFGADFFAIFGKVSLNQKVLLILLGQSLRKLISKRLSCKAQQFTRKVDFVNVF